MAVAVENNSTQSVSLPNYSTEFWQTVSFNVPTGSTMLTVMFMDQGNAPTSVIWDGSSGTALTQRVTQDDGNDSGTQLWDLQDPDSGTLDLYLGYVSNLTWRVHIVALSGTDDTTARGGTATATGWSATCTLSPTTVDTDFVIGCSSMGNTPTLDTGTALYTGESDTNGNSSSAYATASGAGQELEWSQTAQRTAAVCQVYKEGAASASDIFGPAQALDRGIGPEMSSRLGGVLQ